MMNVDILRLLRAFSVSAVAGTALFISSCTDSDRYVAVTGFAQGGTYSVKFNLRGPDGMVRVRPEKIKEGIDSVLLAVDNSLSGYNKGSLLSRFNAGETIVPDSLFIDIYERSCGFYSETGGVVDVASAPLFDIWGFGFTSDSLPSPSRVESAMASSGLDRLRRDMVSVIRDDGTLRPSDLLGDGAGDVLPELNYNAVAQGYTCDVVADYLYSLGIRDMLVDIGGEIYCDGLNPSRRRWSIGIDRPVDGSRESGEDIQAVLTVPEGAKGIVTSGNYRKFYIRDGKKYAHTIDPRTGYPVDHSLLSATVMTGGDAALADALATYCMVIGFEEASRFIGETDGLEGYLVYDEDGEMKSWASSGFELR